MALKNQLVSSIKLIIRLIKRINLNFIPSFAIAVIALID